MKKLLLCISILIIIFKVDAQTDSSKTKDYCMMKNGKMMQMKSGQLMLMDTILTMKDGSMCKPNGECIMKDGSKIQLKEGDRMEMGGKMNMCPMMGMGGDTKSEPEMKSGNMNMAKIYTCPMHPEVISDKPGKCPICGMDLIEKK